jgi:Xaa-Pro aminopeptidase
MGIKIFWSFRDGTTDITRTIHFGEPTAEEKEGYTRVLKGQIALATAKFPYKTVGHRLDSFARQFLWDVGLEYNHGTGHGIGHALNVRKIQKQSSKD